MSHQKVRIQHDEEAARERLEDLKLEAEIEECVRNWRRGTWVLGIALVADAACWISLLFGFPSDRLSRYAHSVGTPLPLLFSTFICVAAITWNYSEYLGKVKKIHHDYPPEEGD